MPGINTVPVRPTRTDPSDALVDSFVWIKIPGESDGESTRGLGPGGETVHAEWGIIDPAAGRLVPRDCPGPGPERVPLISSR